MDQQLKEQIEQAQAGDRQAFSQLIDQHYSVMFRFACKFCGNRSDAEDVTQQACIKLARAIGQFRFEAAFTTWLYRIVINCAHDWQRKVTPEAESDESSQPTMEENPDSGVMLRQVLQLVSQMGEGFRETVVLVMGEGLTHAEAASVLDIKESTVSWRLHEVRKRLSVALPQGSEL